MKVKLIQIGKTHFDFVEEGFAVYANRLKHYCKLECQVLEIPTRLKSSDPEKIKKLEAQLLEKAITPQDYLILLDEKGKEYASEPFAHFLQKQYNHHPVLVFVIGGAYGFDVSMYDRANAKVSLSRMTFSHQLIRLVFAEQLYRAFTIMKGEPYHHA